MIFSYDHDGLGDKLQSKTAAGFNYTIRPVQFENVGELLGATPATFDDFDVYTLYRSEGDGLDTALEDFETVREAISYAEKDSEMVG